MPGQSVAAGYCDIVNQGDQAVSIVRFAGPVRVEMHETTHQGGMARMRPLARLPIAANATLSLQPGGKHLMLFGLDAALGEAAGQITLRRLVRQRRRDQRRFRRSRVRWRPAMKFDWKIWRRLPFLGKSPYVTPACGRGVGEGQRQAPDGRRHRAGRVPLGGRRHGLVVVRRAGTVRPPSR